MASDNNREVSDLYSLPFFKGDDESISTDIEIAVNIAPDQHELLNYIMGMSTELSCLCASSNLDVLAYFFEMAHIEANERRKAL